MHFYLHNHSGSSRIIVFIINDKNNTKHHSNSQYNISHTIRVFTLSPCSQQQQLLLYARELSFAKSPPSGPSHWMVCRSKMILHCYIRQIYYIAPSSRMPYFLIKIFVII